MYVLTYFGADLRSHRRQIALVLLSALLWSSATVAGAGTKQHENTAQLLERFAFTGTYRFKPNPTAAPRKGKRAAKRVMVATSSPPDSRQTDQPSRDLLGPRRMPKAPSVAVATPARSSTPVAVTAAPAPVYIVPRKIKNTSVSRRSIKTATRAKPSTQKKALTETALSTRAMQTLARVATSATRNVRSDSPPKAPLSRDTRSSLGASPENTLKAIAKKGAPDQVASPAPSQQRSEPSPAASIAKAAQTSLPVVHIAVATPAITGEHQAITLQPSGRTINVPPLPALYRRPAGATQKRNGSLANRSKRIAKRAAKPQSAKPAKSKPASIFDAQPAWANNALFKSD